MFRVNCESIPRQVNFLTDEAADCGKGANAVISQVHYCYENRGLGRRRSSCMQIIVQARIKIAAWSNTS